MHAVAARVDEQDRGPEEEVSGRDLLVARAQQVRDRPVAPAPDREDRAERAVDVDVRGAVHRVEEHRVAALGEVAAVDHGLLHLLRGRQRDEPAVVEGLEQDLVGDDVELLLLLALDVGRAGRAVRLARSPRPRARRDALGGDAEAHEQQRQLAGRARRRPLLLENEPVERDRRGAHRHGGLLLLPGDLPAARRDRRVAARGRRERALDRVAGWRPTNVVWTSQLQDGSV